MKVTLSENIRTFRKARGLTQEALAEMLNVSLGVISKWETGLSAPDLGLLTDLAELFGTSVDVLLGYRQESRSREERLEALRAQLHRQGEPLPLAFVESCLLNYPNDFEMVYRCAELLSLRGMQPRDTALLERSLDLFRRACDLANEHSGPSPTELRIGMAGVLRCLDRDEEAIELLKAHNPCGVNHADIGCYLAQDNRNTDALPWLSKALIQTLGQQMTIAFGYMNAFYHLGRYREVVEVIDWITGSMEALKRPGSVSYLEKQHSAMLCIRTSALLRLGRREDAGKSLAKARDLALRFDAAPCYRADRLRFVEPTEATAYDDYGPTALEGLETLIAQQKDPVLAALWQEVRQG